MTPHLRENIASQRGEIRAKHNIIDVEGVNMREEGTASESVRREWG